MLVKVVFQKNSNKLVHYIIKKFCLIIFFAGIFYLAQAQDKAGHIYNILDFGASDDTTAISTKAIQKAIDLCSEKGGIVWVPKGRFVSGTLFLKNNVQLYIEAGAEILGSQSLNDYASDIPVMVEDPKFSHCLIFAQQAKNISITGMGKINGRGYKQYFNKQRPMLMRLVECQNVSISNVTLENAASWCALFVDCDVLRINGVKLNNRVQYNNDGFDFNGCRDVVISDCIISSNDDAICGKSTTNRLLENMVVTNCIISSDCSGFKLGTSSKTGFKNISVTNCIMNNCFLGAIKLICVDGGILENISISDIVMNNVDGPFFIRLGGRGKTYLKPQDQDYSLTGVNAISGTPLGEVKNISISNIRADIAGTQPATSGILLLGMKEKYISDIRLSNIQVTFAGSGKAEDTRRIVPDMDKVYPEPSWFGILPSYGLYARHVKGLTLENITFSYKGNTEERPAIRCNDVQDATFSNLNLLSPKSEQAPLVMDTVSNIMIQQSYVKHKAKAFLKVSDNESNNIRIFSNDLSNCEQIVDNENETVVSKIKVDSNILNK